MPGIFRRYRAVVVPLKALPFLFWLPIAFRILLSWLAKACMFKELGVLASKFNKFDTYGSSKRVAVTSTFKPFFFLPYQASKSRSIAVISFILYRLTRTSSRLVA